MIERHFDVVCLSHLRWDWVWQRPQHLLSRCARSHRVFYVEEPTEAAETRIEVTKVEAGVYVVKPHVPPALTRQELDAVQQTLLDELFVEYEVDDYLLWVYSPMAATFAEHLEPVATVYDCMDELSLFAGAPPELAERERALLEAADLVFTGGASLFEAKRSGSRNVHCFPSSVETEHFARARETASDTEDQAAIPHPRIGYVGVIDERLDLELIGALARARSDWSFVFVGPVTKIDAASLPQHPNIYYLGPKEYGELPQQIAGWDVAWMPFALNDATRFISPTKTLEYLAAGKPVVSTPIADVVRPYGEAGIVMIARSVAESIAAMEQALGGRDSQWLEQVDATLARTSWDATWSAMNELIRDAIGAKAWRHHHPAAPAPFDYLVVGAGFAGAVLAERLARQAGQRVLVVDRRNHIGGNAYDRYDAAGILVHKYGPHIFHTNSRDVFDYLSQFTEWRRYEHRVRASVDGRLVPLPINLDTINELYGTSFDSNELARFFDSVAEPVEHVRTSEDVVVSKVGRELYEKFFRNYTRKQWDLDPSQLDASVAARVPTRLNRDDRYFADTYQSMPAHGYTRMFERMLDHPNIKVMLQTDYREIVGSLPFREMVYTGPVDEFFDLRYGKLPYRSLEFVFETHDMERFQSAPVVNFPNEHSYTRSTEFKYLTGQSHPKTTVVYELPRAEGDPYYPVPQPENGELYKRYKALADATQGVHFVGRLATYKYYNMDQVVAQALSVFRKIKDGDGVRCEAFGRRNGRRAITRARTPSSR
jgi:UDP-galactopyranose mutase